METWVELVALNFHKQKRKVFSEKLFWRRHLIVVQFPARQDEEYILTLDESGNVARCARWFAKYIFKNIIT